MMFCFVNGIFILYDKIKLINLGEFYEIYEEIDCYAYFSYFFVCP